jgi:hypothetical protein
MLLAAFLLLCPFPRMESIAKPVANTAEVLVASASDATNISARNSTNDAVRDSTSDSISAPENSEIRESSLSQPSLLAPEPKVKTDAEIASAGLIEPGYTPAQPATPLKGVRTPVTRPTETPVQRKLWYALSITSSGAAVFDAWSTRRAISQGYGTEGNPLLRPFSHSSAIYVATQASPLLMDYIGKRMMVSQHKWMRSMWWLPQSAGTGFSLYAGVHNTRLVP